MLIHNKVIWGLSLIKSIGAQAAGLYFLLNGQIVYVGAALVVGGGWMAGAALDEIIAGENKYLDINLSCKCKKAKESKESKKETLDSPTITSFASNLMNQDYDRTIFQNEKGIQLLGFQKLESLVEKAKSN